MEKLIPEDPNKAISLSEIELPQMRTLHYYNGAQTGGRYCGTAPLCVDTDEHLKSSDTAAIHAKMKELGLRIKR